MNEEPDLESQLEILRAAADAGDTEARTALQELERDVKKLKNKAGSSWATERHRVGGGDKGIVNRLTRAIGAVQTETGNRMSSELAEHYRQAVVKRRRRKKDAMAKKSRKRNRGKHR